MPITAQLHRCADTLLHVIPVLQPGALREILPGVRRPILGPLTSGFLVETCLACCYSNLNSASQTEGKLPPKVICASSGGNAEPKPHCCSML